MKTSENSSALTFNNIYVTKIPSEYLVFLVLSNNRCEIVLFFVDNQFYSVCNLIVKFPTVPVILINRVLVSRILLRWREGGWSGIYFLICLLLIKKKNNNTLLTMAVIKKYSKSNLIMTTITVIY